MKRFSRSVVASTLSLLGFSAAISVANAVPPPKAFGELPMGFDADLSPDGKHLAMIGSTNGTYFIATREAGVRSAKIKGIALGANLRPRYIKWVNNERFVLSVETTKFDGDTPFTVTHLFTKSFEERAPRQLLRPKIFRQFNDRVVDWLEDDPDHILMEFSKKAFDPYPDIHKVAVKNGKSSRVLRGSTGIEHWITDDNGVPRIGYGETNLGEARMRVFNSAKEKWESEKEYPGLKTDTPIFSILNNGADLIIGSYEGRDTLGLYIYNLNEKRVTRELFHNEQYDASGVVISKDGETVIGAKYIADEEQTELLGEYGTLLTSLRQKLSGSSIRFVSESKDGGMLIVRVSGASNPGGLYVYSRGDSEPTLLQSNYSVLKAKEMGNVIATNYRARDGQEIPAYITLPPTMSSLAELKDVPFVVLPHGGPYGRDEKRFDYFAQFFATRGYGVMQMNFRGSAGYGKSFKDAGRDNWTVMQEDVEDATRHLLNQGYADPNRTCIAGWSYGGYAALMGAAKDTDGLYDCVIAMAALTDIENAKRDLRDYRGGKQVAKTFFGDAMNDKDVRRANSPVHVAADIKVPVFLAHGTQDISVRFDQFVRMDKALRKAGVKTMSMALQDEDHYLSRQENREAFFVGLDKFLTEVNGSSEFMAK